MANKLEYILSLKDQFTSKMRSAAKETEKLDKGLGKSTQRFSDLRKAAERMQKMNEKARIDAIISAKTGESMFSRMSGAALAGWAVAGAGVVSFGKSVFDNLVKYEYFSTGLRTMMKGDGLAAAALEGQLIALAKTTPFELEEVQEATKRLMAYGVAGGEVVDKLKMLGNVSAGLGKQSLPFLITAFGQIKAKGHLAGQELNQLTEQGFNPLNIIMKKTGKTYEQLLKDMEKGLITFADVNDAFKTATSSGGQFFNLMEEQSRTVGGRWSGFMDVWNQIQVNIGKSQTGILAGTIKWVSDMADTVNNKLILGNIRDEIFKTEKAKAESLGSKYEGFGVLSSSKIENQRISMLQSMVDKSGGSASGISKMFKFLNALDKGDLSDKTFGKINAEAYNTEKRINDFFRQKTLGMWNLLKSKPNPNETIKLDENGNPIKTGTKESKSIGTGIDVVGTRPQSLVININELVHELKVSSTNLTEGVMKIKEEMAKVLLEVVNDVNYAVR